MPSTSSVLLESGIAFGTSGARGLVTQFTPQVCMAFTQAFVSVMQQNFAFNAVAIAIDNRPSSYAMAQACVSSLISLGLKPIYFGIVPTPALAFAAMQQNVPSIMVTGSHIPFDRNGLKFYRPDGEITKADELAILDADAELLEPDVCNLPTVSDFAATSYISRYLDLFSSTLLVGKRIGIYEHSSAGRDLYAKLFQKLGAEVVSIGRSDQFVPIDTEAVSVHDIEMAKRWQSEYQLDAIFSTDGDGDRPLLADETGTYLRGDILCLLAAQFLGIEALAIPVSCNSSVEACGSFTQVLRTKIGSPYVIEAFAILQTQCSRIAGFEANGGFLLGADIDINGISLNALPTRDALLPALAVLAMAANGTISSLVAKLPAIFTASDRIQNFAREYSVALIEQGIASPKSILAKLSLDQFEVLSTDTTDGLRMLLSNGDVVHLRSSGNAPELRCYAESKSVEAANSLVELVLSSITNHKDLTFGSDYSDISQ
ncbi:phosphomannomutase [Vibrio cholerae]|uniref:phosphomannomutase n=1 Tax=Vibrio cholerae TaxID=666 RepID=UPI000E0C112B|nr:phosphomannomutase [Vibrio cholerae]MCD6657580.1 phosphomannomutase [Vibrio cholerae]TQP24663.1 phosphomannomutase [Vibrio cholerae]BCN18536.1 phosphoglucosamine mutase [Vibrio cholerae]BCN21706.1 phosphoglucosamine mutase [Vibrio cholerae]GHY15080.1 phosphomannomutase [Vibrio cholerae]